MAQVTPREKLSGTTFTWELRKPHPGLIQFVIVFPDGDYWVWREVELHDADKVASNVGSVGPLPDEWVVENEAQRLTRLAAEEAAAHPPETE